MAEQRILLSAGIVVFCATTILYRFIRRKKQRKEDLQYDSSSDESYDDTESEVDSRNADIYNRYSYADICNLDPSASIPPNLYSLDRDRPNTISQVDDCHVTTVSNNWNHFECYQKGRDTGHQIHSTLDDDPYFIEDDDYQFPDKRKFSEWDMTMNADEIYNSSESSYSTGDEENSNLLRKNLKSKIDRFTKIMPNKLILVRHGQSEGNVSEKIYQTKPDNSISLTKLGWEQARMAGKGLKESIIGPDESIHFIVSPYVRTVETFHGMLSAWVDPSEFNHIFDKNERTIAWYKKCFEMGITWSEDPRIREQDFGNYQDPAAIEKAKQERHEFGTFYYRFPHGESASDVFDRVSTFLDSLWRSFDSKKAKNYVVVTHGISIRVFLARYFRYTIDQFNIISNPKNCEMIVLSHDGMGKLKLDGRSELTAEEEYNDIIGEKEKVMTGYAFHRKLRVVPAHHRRTRNVKNSFND